MFSQTPGECEALQILGASSESVGLGGGLRFSTSDKHPVVLLLLVHDPHLE